MTSSGYINTEHPAPEMLMGIGGVYRKLASLKAENEKLSELVSSNSSGGASAAEILSVAQVASLLGKSEKTIRRWAKREHDSLPSIKVLQNEQYSWSFNRVDVLEWFNLHRQI
jgi:predicted DNA-binding transcriptional regulator AlpA